MVDGQPPPAFTRTINTRKFQREKPLRLDAFFMLCGFCPRYSMFLCKWLLVSRYCQGSSYITWNQKRARGLVCLASPRLAWPGLAWFWAWLRTAQYVCKVLLSYMSENAGSWFVDNSASHLLPTC